MKRIQKKADTTRFQVDQPISRQRFNLFVGYKLDAHRVDLIEKVLHGNRSGLCVRKWIAMELLRNLKKERSDVQLMLNTGQSGKVGRNAN